MKLSFARIDATRCVEIVFTTRFRLWRAGLGLSITISCAGVGKQRFAGVHAK